MRSPTCAESLTRGWRRNEAMATLESIRRLKTEVSIKGADETAAALRKVEGAVQGVATASEKTTKASLSVEQALARQQRALDGNYRANQQFARSERDLRAAREQGL